MFGKKESQVASRPMGLYVIFDRASETSGPVQEAHNDAVASRMFRNAMQKVPYASDFQLLHVGFINHENNIIQPVTPRQVVITVDLEAEEDASHVQ